jgi:hypothetical protein
MKTPRNEHPWHPDLFSLQRATDILMNMMGDLVVLPRADPAEMGRIRHALYYRRRGRGLLLEVEEGRGGRVRLSGLAIGVLLPVGNN